MNYFTNQNDPQRAPDWRDQIALGLAVDRRLASPRIYDQATIAQRRFYRKLTNCRNERDLRVLQRKLPSHWKAYQLSQNTELRNMLECLLLGNESYLRIRQMMNCDIDVIEHYEAIFFDVRGRLGHTPWVFSAVLPDTHTNDDEKAALYSAWRFTAYVVGATAIKNLMLHGKQPGKWERLPDVLQRRAKALITMYAVGRKLGEGSGGAGKDATELIRLSQQLAQDESDASAPLTRDDQIVEQVLEFAKEACGRVDSPSFVEP